ncbi:MAG: AMP-binding protein [Nocardioides sp.]|uniref:(2,3-dihydroxybenzoyl)adenylate synthase n=1 Tax=Nocardioides sp. TaxID=35761 RepID=UPI0039E678F6
MRSAALDHPRPPVADQERYRRLGYWLPETFGDFVAERTTRFAGNTALIAPGIDGTEIRWTYAELADQAERSAGRLLAAGVTPWDRVLLSLPNVAEYLGVLLGCFRLGAVPIFALPTHREAELAQFCAIADPAAWVHAAEDDLLDAVADRAGELGVEPPAAIDVRTWPADRAARAGRPPALPLAATTPADLAFLQLSGGTTGISKLIPRAAEEYLYSVRASAEICGLDASTVMLVVLPAAHNFPLSSPGILGTLHVGGTIVFAPDPSPRTAFGLIESERVTDVALVPPLAQAWISAARRRRPDLSSLRTVQVGGARLSDVVAAEVRPVLHGRLQQVFGMAEGLVNYTRHDDPDDLVRTTQGRPISAEDEIRIVDRADRDVPEGEIGALLTRGPYTIRGYYGAPSWTAAVNDSSFTADGYYRTGDLVRRLPSGHLVVTGREKDQINRAGEKVATEEIEGPLLAHPAVLDAVAVGVPDHYLGERICVVIRTEPDAPRPTDLGRHLRAAGLAEHKIPDSFEYLEEFPVTGVGKNSRRELRRVLAAQLGDRTASATAGS